MGLKKKGRSYIAGVRLGESLVEMAHLMYQNRTALHFLRGLKSIIEAELENREVVELERKKK